MRRKGIVVGAMLMAMGLLGSAAGAAETPVQFATTSTGTRTLAIGTAPAFPASTDLFAVSGDIATSVAAVTTVTEVFAAGANFSVNARLCGPNTYSLPTASDCTTHPNRLMRATGTNVNDALMGSTISISRTGATTSVGTPAGTVTDPALTSLGAPADLFSVAEVASTAYNGLYTATNPMTINDLTRTGTWKGYWVVTLQL